MAEGAGAPPHAHGGRILKLSAEAWREAEPLLNAALELDTGERGAWLASLEGTRPHLAPLLRRLLASHDRAERSGELEGTPRLRPAGEWTSPHASGERIGPFELVRPLGRGGMGEVWLARQVDGRVQREAAIKLPAMLPHAEAWRERFERERDILASLEHPHIARFYDAGVAESGQPWLAMEYVSGRTLLDHSQARGLPMAMRLALFRQVLDAVAYAHRHLVVHRDLKPGNILVDEMGEVKLLDFGIAKLVQEQGEVETAADLTRLGGRVMTLRYAAPEQVAGEAMTTAADIYALGVVLHELVTGQSPYRSVRDGKPLSESVLLQEAPTLPSRLAPGLGGDLDAILLKAMRREPTQRYASVELFDADLLAHLERRPVKARAGTWRYLGGRFVARHKVPMALAAAVLVSLVAGLVVAEAERREAVAERARAERHFASVRKLANTLIFDVHGKLENLPGSLPAREALIAKSLEYLDALAAERGRDPELMLDIASAYRRIAGIQGEPRGANRGNPTAAIANYEKATALLTELGRMRPGDVAVAREHWTASYALAYIYFQVLDDRWREEMRRNIVLADRIAREPGASLDDRLLGVFIRAREAHLNIISNGRTAKDEAIVADAVARFEAALPSAPPEALLRERLAALYRSLGVTVAGPGEGEPRLAESITYFEKALGLTRALLQEAPADARRQAFERQSSWELARYLARHGDLRRADDLIAEVLARVEKGIALDPQDVTLAVSRLEILVGGAEIAMRLRDAGRAQAISREVLASARRLPAEAARIRDVRMQVAEAKVILGYALVSSAETPGREREASIAQLLEAKALFADVAKFVADVAAQPTLGAIPDYKLREFAAARARCDKALARLSGA